MEERRTSAIRETMLQNKLDRKKNKELDETIVQTCKWIQRKLQISDKSIKDEKVPEMMSALAVLVAAREETLNQSMIF